MEKTVKKRKCTGGFTLVELIVVIAILAILAGVGTVAYTGYITATRKGVDRTLVGESSWSQTAEQPRLEAIKVIPPSNPQLRTV